MNALFFFFPHSEHCYHIRFSTLYTINPRKAVEKKKKKSRKKKKKFSRVSTETNFPNVKLYRY